MRLVLSRCYPSLEVKITGERFFREPQTRLLIVLWSSLDHSGYFGYRLFLLYTNGKNTINHPTPEPSRRKFRMPQHDASDPATERPTPKRLISIGAGTVVMHDDRVLLVRN